MFYLQMRCLRRLCQIMQVAQLLIYQYPIRIVVLKSQVPVLPFQPKSLSPNHHPIRTFTILHSFPMGKKMSPWDSTCLPTENHYTRTFMFSSKQLVLLKGLRLSKDPANFTVESHIKRKTTIKTHSIFIYCTFIWEKTKQQPADKALQQT